MNQDRPPPLHRTAGTRACFVRPTGVCSNSHQRPDIVQDRCRRTTDWVRTHYARPNKTSTLMSTQTRNVPVAFRRCGLHASCVLIWTGFGKHQETCLEDPNGYTAWDGHHSSPRLSRQTWAMATPTPTSSVARALMETSTCPPTSSPSNAPSRSPSATHGMVDCRKLLLVFSLCVTKRVSFRTFLSLGPCHRLRTWIRHRIAANPRACVFSGFWKRATPASSKNFTQVKLVVAHVGPHREKVWLSGFVFQAASANSDVKVAAINDAFTPIGYMVYNSYERVHGRWRSCALTSSTARPRQHCRSERSWPVIVFKYQSSYTGTGKAVHQVIFESGCTDMGIVSTDLVTSPMLPTTLKI